ncbi:hypothetical protein AVEN_216118-1, partial [Araneus ventricosus]
MGESVDVGCGHHTSPWPSAWTLNPM